MIGTSKCVSKGRTKTWNFRTLHAAFVYYFFELSFCFQFSFFLSKQKNLKSQSEFSRQLLLCNEIFCRKLKKNPFKNVFQTILLQDNQRISACFSIHWCKSYTLLSFERKETSLLLTTCSGNINWIDFFESLMWSYRF